ncbi:MAG: hypothetical protein GEU74_02110 [Nitriliruptorales bacterium]|nr:hypothetical protein [Nitriliruptorales bacterium]
MTHRVVRLVLVVILTGCADAGGGQQVTRPPAGEPYIDGTVKRVEPPESIQVGERGGGNEAVLRITPQTRLLREFGGGYEPAVFADLREGQAVSVWVAGPIAESFPVQAAADAVVITRD